MQMLSMGFKKPNSKIMCTIYAVQRQEKSSVIIYAQLSTTTQIAVLRALEASLLVQLILVFKDQHTGTEYYVLLESSSKFQKVGDRREQTVYSKVVL